MDCVRHESELGEGTRDAYLRRRKLQLKERGNHSSIRSATGTVRAQYLSCSYTNESSWTISALKLTPGSLRCTAAPHAFCIIGIPGMYYHNANGGSTRCIHGCRPVSNREAAGSFRIFAIESIKISAPFQFQEEILIRYEGSTRCFTD